MAENGAAESQQAPQVQMRILAQYIRDMSFENVMVQKGSSGEVQPDINITVNLDAAQRPQDNQYEVVLKVTVDNKDKNSGGTLFMLELEYGGVFHIEGIPEDQMHPFLLIECPRMLFPFVRRIISDVTRDGGFPPLNLDNIDFVGLYRNELARRQSEASPENA